MQEQQTLGRRIQEARKAAGLSQESLGERLGVSRQAVSKWEADTSVPELENLIAMSRIFGVTIGALLGVETPEEAPETEGAASEETEAGTAPAGCRRRAKTSKASASPARARPRASFWAAA